MANSDLPKRSLHRAAKDAVVAFDAYRADATAMTRATLAVAMRHLSDALAVEGQHATARARQSQIRRLTPQQRAAKAERARRTLEELEALNG